MKRIIALAGALILVFALTGCKHNTDPNDETYLAGGTIPESAKIYPIVNEELEMTVNDEENTLSAEDIWTLTHYVDVFAKCDDTRGDGMDEKEMAVFCSQERIDSIKAGHEDNDFSYSITGVQVLIMTVQDDGRVVADYVTSIEGENEPAEISEGKYESYSSLRFEKRNGKWYEDGISFGFMAPAGTVECTRDDITGEYTFNPTAEIYK